MTDTTTTAIFGYDAATRTITTRDKSQVAAFLQTLKESLEDPGLAL